MKIGKQDNFALEINKLHLLVKKLFIFVKNYVTFITKNSLL